MRPLINNSNTSLIEAHGSWLYFIGASHRLRINAPESTLSSSDEEWNAILHIYDNEKQKLRPRIINYENVINRYSNFR